MYGYGSDLYNNLATGSGRYDNQADLHEVVMRALEAGHTKDGSEMAP